MMAVTSCSQVSNNIGSGEQDGELPSQKELTENQMSVAGIALGTLENRELSQVVVTNGYFDVPPQNKAQVSTFKAGYVKSTKLLVGNSVQKGQVLVVLENPEFVRIQQEYMEVKGQLGYLKSEYERKKILEQEKITAKRNLQRAQADYNSTLARFQGLQKELQLMGINMTQLESGNISTVISVRSPISGTVTRVNTAIGKYVLPEEVLVEIVNPDHLHVELEVFEKDISNIEEGQKIRLRIPSLTKSQYWGEVYLVGKALDIETRTIQVHGHVPEEKSFVPGMYVEADIMVESKTVWAVPERAVLSEGEEQYLFIVSGTRDDRTSFKKIPVSTGVNFDGWTEITSTEDLDERTQIVVEGGYYLSSSEGA
jgi:cobalt-zinc-cadmium efflux system membrane fusion protein